MLMHLKWINIVKYKYYPKQCHRLWMLIKIPMAFFKEIEQAVKNLCVGTTEMIPNNQSNLEKEQI